MVGAAKAMVPVSISQTMAASANTSERASTSWMRPSACSGDMYAGEPSKLYWRVMTVIESRTLDSPKSSSLTWSRPSRWHRKTLAGLRSRWTICARCAASSADAA